MKSLRRQLNKQRFEILQEFLEVHVSRHYQVNSQAQQSLQIFLDHLYGFALLQPASLQVRYLQSAAGAGPYGMN